MNFENNVLSILSFASTRSTWVSVSSCVERCNLDYRTVWNYFTRDDMAQIARFYRYEYCVRRRHGGFYLSVVSRGYA